ncbi:MAG: threonine aldolase family protein [Desulfobacterales bacterium]|nr:threonine aldolase family protein [Desulfobacterales bacterium]
MGTAMQGIRIDLYSDTITKPTPAMRKAMSEAEVGDEQQKEDPTVNRLVEMVCELLGKEDAIFLPSGTMCNQIAWRVYCRPGDEIIMDETAHTRHFETGGPAALSGAMTYPLQGERGIFSAFQLEAAIRPPNNHFPRSRAILIEQTSNLGGGSIWPLDTIQEVCAMAHKRGLACHMDGARLLNAVVATGIPAREYASPFDSLWIDFSKGLGAPVGAALAGSKSFIRDAWRWKHQFGGAMRQAGIIAAGAVYALGHHVERLAEDHENAKFLAEGLARIQGIRVEPAETNLVFFDVSGLGITAQTFNERLTERGLRVSVLGNTLARAVTHLDVSRSQVEEALEIMGDVVRKIRG